VPLAKIPTAPLARTSLFSSELDRRYVAESTGGSEWVRVAVNSCNDEPGILFGRLDSVPLLGTDLRLRDQLSVSDDKVVEYRKASDFEKQ